jgi:uncharacterized protein (DUF302 family)
VIETRLGLHTTVPLDFDQAVERTTAALRQEGFGVLTSIDLRQTLKQKLDVDFRRYVILGACNPPLAHRALQADLEAGLLLPCNVVVHEEDEGRTRVAAMAPIAMIATLGEQPELAAVATEADARLRRVLTALETLI